MTALEMQERRSGWIPWVFALGMLLVVVVNGALVFFAFGSWYGLATDHAYERGRAYNKVLDATERQAALGWGITAALRPAEGGARLVVSVADRQGWGLEGLVLTAVVERPVGRAERRQVALAMEAPGSYAVLLAGLPRGQWSARIEVEGAGARVVAARRLTLP